MTIPRNDFLWADMLCRAITGLSQMFPIAHQRRNIGECGQDSHRRRHRVCLREDHGFREWGGLHEDLLVAAQPVARWRFY
jgi:hypothetical protein